MSDPHPGFLAGFKPSFGRALRNALPGRKALILLFVLAVPPILMGEPARFLPTYPPILRRRPLASNG